jgi:hypothetical protein
MNTENLGGIIGGVLGILGGIVGTYFSVRNTKSLRERRFVIHAGILVWCALGLTALAVFYLPTLRAWAWVPICVMVAICAPFCNRRQEIIRQEEARKSS